MNGDLPQPITITIVSIPMEDKMHQSDLLLIKGEVAEDSLNELEVLSEIGLFPVDVGVRRSILPRIFLHNHVTIM